MRERHHTEHSGSDGPRRLGHTEGLVLRGRLQHPGHAHQTVQAVRLPPRLQDPRHRTNRARHGQDDGPGTRSSHYIPVAANHVCQRRQEQRDRGLARQGDASELRVGPVSGPAGTQPQGGVATTRDVGQQRRTVNIGVLSS